MVTDLRLALRDAAAAAPAEDLDLAAVLGAGARRVRRRRVTTAALATAVVAVLAATGIAASRGHDRGSEPVVPATPSPSAAKQEMLLANPINAESMSGGNASRLHLPSPSPGSGSYYSLAFSPDGTQLAYAFSDVRTIDLATGRIRLKQVCGQEDLCSVAWTPDGRTILVANGRLRGIDVATGRVHEIPVPAGWTWFTSPDVNTAGRVVMGGTVDGDVAIMSIDLAGTHPQVLERFRNTGTPIDPRWSPDGTRIAYVLLQGRPRDPPQDTPLSLRTMNADGSGLRTLAKVGHCYCLGFAPGMDWSPSGRLAVATMGIPPFTTSGAVFEISADGTPSYFGPGHGPIAWRPAP